MPCIIRSRRFFFRILEVYCDERPYEDNKADYIIFYYTRRRNDKFSCREIYTAVLDLRPSIDDLFKGLNSKLRKDIRRAYRENIEIRVNRDYDEFHKLAVDFHKAKGLPLSLVPSIEFMKRHGYLLTAYIENRIVAGQFYMACYPTLLYHAASRIISDNPKESQMIGRAVKVLVWEAIRLGKSKNYQELNFGGISKEMSSGIDFFKLRYGAKPEIQYVCKKANNLLLNIYLHMRDLIKQYVR